jgi:enterobacteria phage integrase
LVRYALALGWIDRDPTAGAKAYRSKEIHTWNEEEFATFEKHWLEGTRERLAFALLLYTGQRGSDVHRMLWTDNIGDTIRVAQQKTATKLTIPIHESLARLVATAKRDHPTILVTVFKKPFSVKGFGNRCQMRSATPDCLVAASRMGYGRPLRDVSQRRVAQQAR